MTYEHMKEELKFINGSNVRLRIMVDLSKKPHRLIDFNKDSLLTYSSLSTNIHKLCERRLVEKVQNKFRLTNIGRIYLIALMDFQDELNTINNFSDFWLNHDIYPISNSYFHKLSSLKGSELISSSPSDIYRTHEEFRKIFTSASVLKVIFPYFHPEYPKLIRRLVLSRAKIEIILPRVISRRFVQCIGEVIVKDAIENGLLRILEIDEHIKLALAISDKNVSIGLFKTDGSYDQNRLLVSCEEKAIDWANKLFNSYRDDARNFIY